jgi:hypothetical protein
MEGYRRGVRLTLRNHKPPKGYNLIREEERRVLHQQQRETMEKDRRREAGYAKRPNISYKFSRKQVLALWNMCIYLPNGLEDEFTIIGQDNYEALKIVTSTGREYYLPQDGGWEEKHNTK